MEFHQYANIYPMMTELEFDKLCRSFAKHGYIQEFPILVYKGKILDGRNRFNACENVGVLPMFTEFAGTDDQAFDLVNASITRKHWTLDQLGMIALEYEVIESERAKERMLAGKPIYPRDESSLGSDSDKGGSAEKAAKQVGVTRKRVQRSKALKKKSPELAEKVKDGTLKLVDAEKKLNKEQRDIERKALAATAENIKPDDRWNISLGDMTTWQTDKRYDFIVTDPPYPKEYLHLYEVLAIRSKEWLKDGGLLVAMCGQSYLNQIYEMISRHLTYYWTAAYLLPNQPTPLRQRQVNTSWKPILIFAKSSDYKDYKGKIFGDVFVSDVKQGDKTLHDWGQSVIGMYSLIKQICLPGQSIFDPFCGAGTTGIAALKHGCLFDGIDTDQESVNISKGRLSNDG